MSTGRRSSPADGEIDYDYLIIAAGARHSYFGNDEWEKFAPGLKSLDDALEIRRRMLLAFEIAEKTADDAVRHAAMTFVVVGGGPTGMEMAGAIAEIARVTLVKDFRHIDSSQARVLLVEDAPRVIPQFPADLSESARRQLFDIGVEVRVGMLRRKCFRGGSDAQRRAKSFRRERSSGRPAMPPRRSARRLGVPLDKQGRVIVKEDCSIPGHREVFVIGDLAHFGGETPLPGLSPVAMQQGRHVARQIQILLAGGWTQRFDYFDKGTMATIGRNKAVVDAGFMRFSGGLAWLAWLFVHILFLVGFRNKLLVFMNWAYAYLTYGRSARLITGRHSDAKGGKS